jgi:hypothetical protein
MKNLSRRNFLQVTALGTVALGGTSILTKKLLEGASKVLPNTGASPANHKEFSHWSFGGQKHTSPMVAQSTDFRFWFTPAAERREYNFRTEVFQALRKLDKKRNGATVALAYSGGVDSEVLARGLHQLGIPFEMYFVDFWGHNKAMLDHWAKPGAAKLGKELHVVSLEKENFLTQAYNDFAITGCESPTYLGMAQLFDKIPAEQFILTGDGDLQRHGQIYSHLGRKYPVNKTAPGTALSFSNSSVAHEIWAKHKQRNGEFYFFRSTPGLVAAALTSPDFKASYPFSNPKAMVHAAFPEVAPRVKTKNWKGAFGIFTNRRLRQRIEWRTGEIESQRFWHRLTGTVVNGDDIFLKG